MLKSNLEKTVLARKIVLLLLASVAFASVYFLSKEILPKTSLQLQGQCRKNKNLETRTVKAGGVHVDVEIAAISQDRIQGLSGRNCLELGSGMLFTYGLSGDYCFWMKDMKFAIDIVWLDDEGVVVTVKDNVSPETYPDSFCPSRPAQYVLEVPAGYAASSGWAEGTRMAW